MIYNSSNDHKMKRQVNEDLVCSQMECWWQKCKDSNSLQSNSSLKYNSCQIPEGSYCYKY